MAVSSSNASASVPALVPIGDHAGGPTLYLRRLVTVIGSRSDCHLHLVSSTVSKHHAMVVTSEDGVYIRDLASRTKVLINGREVREGNLNDNDVVRIGRFTFKFEAGSSKGRRPKLAAAVAIEVDGRAIRFNGRSIVIGRRSACDIPLADEAVSTTHAVIFDANGKRYIRDLHSRTGTHLNGKPIHHEHLSAGDNVRIGDTAVRVIAADGAETIDELEQLIGTARLTDRDREPEEIDRARPAAPGESQAPISVTPEQPTAEGIAEAEAQEAAREPAEAAAAADPLEALDLEAIAGLSSDQDAAAPAADEVEARDELAPTAEQPQESEAAPEPAPPVEQEAEPSLQEIDLEAEAAEELGGTRMIPVVPEVQKPAPSLAPAAETGDVIEFAPAPDETSAAAEDTHAEPEQPRGRRGWRSGTEQQVAAEAPGPAEASAPAEEAASPQVAPAAEETPTAEAEPDPMSLEAVSKLLATSEDSQTPDTGDLSMAAEPESPAAPGSADAFDAIIEAELGLKPSKPKAAAGSSASPVQDLSSAPVAPAEAGSAPAAEPTKRRRGRPRKNGGAEPSAEVTAPPAAEPSKSKRGGRRGRKNQPDAEPLSGAGAESGAADAPLPTPQPVPAEPAPAPLSEVDAESPIPILDLDVLQDVDAGATVPVAPPPAASKSSDEAVVDQEVLQQPLPTEEAPIQIEAESLAPAASDSESAVEMAFDPDALAAPPSPEVAEEVKPSAPANELEGMDFSALQLEAESTEAESSDAGVYESPAPAAAAPLIGSEPPSRTSSHLADPRAIGGEEIDVAAKAHPAGPIGAEVFEADVQHDEPPAALLAERRIAGLQVRPGDFAEPKPAAPTARAPQTDVPSQEEELTPNFSFDADERTSAKSPETASANDFAAVLPPTEPTPESAFSLEEDDIAKAGEPAGVSAADLSDSKFDAIVEEFAGDETRPLVEASAPGEAGPSQTPAGVAGLSKWFTEPVSLEDGFFDKADQVNETAAAASTGAPVESLQPMAPALQSAAVAESAAEAQALASQSPSVQDESPAPADPGIAGVESPSTNYVDFTAGASGGATVSTELPGDARHDLGGLGAPPTSDSAAASDQRFSLSNEASSPPPAPLEGPDVAEAAALSFLAYNPLGPGANAEYALGGIGIQLPELAPPPPGFGKVNVSFGDRSLHGPSKPTGRPQVPAPPPAAPAELPASELDEVAPAPGEPPAPEAAAPAPPSVAPPRRGNRQPMPDFAIGAPADDAAPQAVPITPPPSQKPAARPPAAPSKFPAVPPPPARHGSKRDATVFATDPFDISPDDVQVDDLGEAIPPFRGSDATSSRVTTAFDGLAMPPVRERDVFSDFSAPAVNDAVFGGRPSAGAGHLVPGASDADEPEVFADSDFWNRTDDDEPAQPARQPSRDAGAEAGDATPLASPDAENKKNRRGGAADPFPPRRHRSPMAVPLLMFGMLLCMGAAAAGVWFVVPHKQLLEASLIAPISSATAPAQRSEFEATQRRLLDDPQTRQAALQAVRTADRSATAGGFLANPETFAAVRRNVNFVTDGNASVAMVLRFETANADGDRKAARALLGSLFAFNSNVGKARAAEADRKNLEDEVRTLQTALRDGKDRLTQQQPVTAPTDEEMAALLAAADGAHAKYRPVLEAVEADRVSVDRLRAAQQDAAATTQPVAEQDTELATVQAQLSAKLAERDRASAADAQKADAARKSLADALAGFQQQLSDAQAAMKDHPELTAYVGAAQELQAQTRQLTDQLLQRRQDSLRELLDFKRRMDEDVAARVAEARANDKTLTDLKEDQHLAEGRYNAAVGSHEDDQTLAQLKLVWDAADKKVEQREAEVGPDNRQLALAERLQQAIDEERRGLEEDRQKISTTMDELQKKFEAAAPAVEKLPAEQKQVADALKQRMDDLAQARRAYAAAVPVTVGDASPETAKLDSEIAELRVKAADREKTLALASQQTASEKEQAEKSQALRDAEDKLTSDRAEMALRTNDYERADLDVLKARARQQMAAETAAAHEALVEQQGQVQKQLDEKLAALQKANAAAAAVIDIKTPSDSDVKITPLPERRLTYILASWGAIAAFFFALSFVVTHPGPRYDTESVPLAAAVDPFGGASPAGASTRAPFTAGAPKSASPNGHADGADDHALAL